MDRFEEKADQLAARSEPAARGREDETTGAASQRVLDRVARLEGLLGELGEWATKMHGWATEVTRRVDGLPDPPRPERDITDQGGRPSHIPR